MSAFNARFSTDLDIDEQEIDTDIPMGRMGLPGGVVDPYLFLASDNAEYVTGHLLYVDKGYRIV